MSSLDHMLRWLAWVAPMATLVGTAHLAAVAATGQSPMTIQAQIGGAVRAVAVSPGRTFLAIGPRIVALDTTLPDLPRVLARSAVLSGPVVDLDLLDDTVLAVVDHVGVRSLALAGNELRSLGAVDLAWGCARPATGDSHMFLACEESSVVAIDVRRPTDLRHLGRVEVTGMSFPDFRAFGILAMIASGARALVFADDPHEGYGALRIIDAASPDGPRLLPGGTSLADTVRSAAAVGNAGYAYSFGGGLEVLDLRHSDGQVIGAVPLPGLYGRYLAAAGDRVWVFPSQSGRQAVAVVDVADPRSPAVVGFFDTNDDLRQGVDFAIAGDIAHTALASGGVALVGLSEPGTVESLGRYEEPGEVFDVAVAGRQVVAVASNGIWTIDPTLPDAPRLVGRFVPPWRVAAVKALGRHLAVAAGASGVRILDTGDAAGIREIGSYIPGGTPSNVAAVAADGAYVFAAANPVATPPPQPTRQAGASAANDGAGELIVLDVSDASAPRPVVRLAYPVPLRRIDARDGLVIGLTDRGDIAVFDVTDPAAPRAAASIAMSPPATSAALAPQRRLLVTADRRLSVFDLSDPASPDEIGSRLRPRQLLAVAADGHLAHVVERYDPGGPDGHAERLQTLDLSDPVRPIEVGHIDTPALRASEGAPAEQTTRLAVADRSVYLAARSSGLVVVARQGRAAVFLPLCAR